MTQRSKLLRSPYLEIIIMISSVVLSYFGLIILGAVPETPADGVMATSTVVAIQFALFMLSVAIALISVIAGIGGGVIFTPIMLAFTSVNSVVVRGAGLIVAMFSGLISTGIFIKKGLCEYRTALLMTISQAIGALIGALLAIGLASSTGATGEGVLRLSLGLVLVALAVYFLTGGKKLEHPEVRKVDRLSASLHLDGEYFEESEGRMFPYKVHRVGWATLLILLVGFIGGFFGMGGGWAITPVLNVCMGLPMKVAAASSGAILGIGSCVSIWAYMSAGAIIPFFVLPWLAGQVIGGFIGSYALARIKVHTVRLILIGIMFFTSFGLVTKALSTLGMMKNPSSMTQVIVFTVIIALVILAIVLDKRKASGKSAPAVQTEQAAAPEPKLPTSVRCYATVVHVITIVSSILALFAPLVILINPSANILNPNRIFQVIFSGGSIEEIWALSSTGSFPGAHYFMTNMSASDSWAQIAISLGCSVGLWALLPTVVIQYFKEKNFVWATLGLLFIALIVLSILGVF